MTFDMTIEYKDTKLPLTPLGKPEVVRWRGQIKALQLNFECGPEGDIRLIPRKRTELRDDRPLSVDVEVYHRMDKTERTGMPRLPPRSGMIG